MVTERRPQRAVRHCAGAEQAAPDHPHGRRCQDGFDQGRLAGPSVARDEVHPTRTFAHPGESLVQDCLLAFPTHELPPGRHDRSVRGSHSGADRLVDLVAGAGAG